MEWKKIIVNIVIASIVAVCAGYTVALYDDKHRHSFVEPVIWDFKGAVK